MAAWPFGLAVNLGILIWFGRSWAINTAFVTDENPDRYFSRIWVKTTVYVVAQCIIIPLILFTVLYGICGINVFGDFH